VIQYALFIFIGSLFMDKDTTPEFTFVTPRPTVEIHLPDGRVICGSRGSSLDKFLAPLAMPDSAPIVGAVVNGELRELTFTILMDSKVTPITMEDADGMLIYRRSLTFLLEAAFEELYPTATLMIDHSVSSGGYYCEVKDHAPLTGEDLLRLADHMRGIVEQNLCLTKKEVPLHAAVEYFQSKGYTDKVRLLAHRQKDYLTLYSLGSHMDYHHGYMVPSTGYLRWFNLIPTNGGFTINFPRRNLPTQLQPMPSYPKLLVTFRRYAQWLDRLGISSVGSLNDAIMASRIHEIILVSEALHEEQVADIAEHITTRCSRPDKKKQVRIILIAGPSSSGKTTLSKRLTIQLLSQGISPFPLAMDNYFVNRDETPKGPDGLPDFEALIAVDTHYLTQDLRRLVAGEEVRLPHYNFKTGMRETGDVIQLEEGQVIILEGIHGLNPDLLPDFPVEQTFRIYASALTQLNLDRHNRISTTDTRLVRRIVRDARERGYTARDTIKRWESVQRGEKMYIFPYQEYADIMFNSALAYELSALKPYAEPLLRQVPYGTREFIEAKRMLALLEWFQPVSSELIPDNSILREFIGDSILKEFKLWNPIV
jgi:uridine kinase